jgi:choline dehydrogenase-like flavoprotein
MRFYDLVELDDNSIIETDLCIIGSGPVGLSIARELAGTNIQVLVLESGGLESEADTQSLYEIKNVGEARCIAQDEVRRHIFGGSSHIWTGRCAPFSDSDFEPRPWVDYSGWPLTRSDLDPYYERAGAYLGLGPHCYDDRLWPQFKSPRPKPLLDDRFLAPIFWQFSSSPNDPKEPVDFGKDITFPNSKNISVLLHANVTHLNTNPAGDRIESVEIKTLSNRQGLVRAKAVVLGCGGIENARLLLASNRISPEGLGNQHDLVGRFLMDHPLCILGYFDPRKAKKLRDRFGFYSLKQDGKSHNYLHGVTLSQTIQQNEKLLQCNAYIEEFDIAPDDPWEALHRILSGLKSKRINSQLIHDSKIAISQTTAIVRGLLRRFVKHRFQLRKATRIEIHCLLEQMPNPESRITLSTDTVDRLGIPISKIDWKISDRERQTAHRMGQLICQEFQRLNLPVPTLLPLSNDAKDSGYIFQFMDKAHPTGTTRISLDPKDGVVDLNLQVHGIQGLFVAGSSVFPTSGAANPTLMIVAMALRLADWLKDSYFSSSDPTLNSSTIAPKREIHIFPMANKNSSLDNANAPIKVGIVGAGQRITNIYLPILHQLSSRYEIVGFTTRSTQGLRKFESKTGIPAFENAAQLVAEQQPSVLITAISSQLNDRILMDLLDLRIPIFTETPLAWTASAGENIIKKAAVNQVLIGVAEQFPYFPLEQFKQRLMELDIFGDIYAVYNDFGAYSYHGMAQLRRYLKGKPLNARCMDYEFGMDPNVNASQFSNIQWQVGSVKFEHNAMLFYNYSDHYVESELCAPQSTRLYGKLGSMTGSDIRFVDQQSGQIQTAVAARHQTESNTLASIRAILPGIGPVTWENPYAAYHFTDEQIAVATLLDGMSEAILTGSQPLYTAAEFLDNTAIMQAFRYSSQRNGASIPFPFNERNQKLSTLANIGYWQRKLSRR